ncbi:hypothetical protein CMV_011442 [Castanea mollissima]|uniref:Uncharacterized protein n=1 Tax=Castanea mollissima TaxID=60419 RepID=A0A8J4R3V8_9ROSI|nr:hypothetical protein CMV_011442 [Castanea mollissima]
MPTQIQPTISDGYGDRRDQRRGLARSAARTSEIDGGDGETKGVRRRRKEQRSGGGSWVSRWSLNDAPIPLKPRSRKKAR